MRAAIMLMGLSFLASGVAAKEEALTKAPTEAAARSATRTLLGAARAGGEAARFDLVARYIDTESVLRDLFGEELPDAGSTDGKGLRVSMRVFLSRALPMALSTIGELPAGVLEARMGAGGLRQVAIPTPAGSPVFVWRAGKRAPILADFGPSISALTLAPLRARWRSSGQSALAFVGGLVRAAESDWRRIQGTSVRANVIRSMDNLRTLVMLLIARRVLHPSDAFPPYSGKNFVLALVAANELDRRKKANLGVLLSPGDKTRSMTDAVFERYKEITKKALKSGTDFSDLTSYAGRRNSERAYLVTPDQEKMGTPLLADLSFPDIALVAFSNGGVREMSREDLGLGPTDPIVVGDASKSKLLRKLSDK